MDSGLKEQTQRYTAANIASACRNFTGDEITARELPRTEWVSTLMKGGTSQGTAQLVADLYDTHSAGLIDVEKSVGEILCGKTDVEIALLHLKAAR